MANVSKNRGLNVNGGEIRPVIRFTEKEAIEICRRRRERERDAANLHLIAKLTLSRFLIFCLTSLIVIVVCI